MLAVMDSQTLILPADKDGADNVTDDEDAQADVMHAAMVVVVVDGEENETDRANNRSNSADQRIELLPVRRVGCKLAGMAHVALKNECQVESDHGDSGHSDKHWLKLLGPDI